MRLTLNTDYSLRVLIYLAAHRNKLVTITELSEFYKISRNHLIHVVHELGRSGYILTMRGRHGGIRLALSPEEIIVGEVVRMTEPNLDLLECFDPATDHCVVTNVCSLKAIFINARNHFIEELDKYSLADITKSTTKKLSSFKSIPVAVE